LLEIDVNLSKLSISEIQEIITGYPERTGYFISKFEYNENLEKLNLFGDSRVFEVDLRDIDIDEEEIFRYGLKHS
jgi:hypothetical protein